MEKNRILKPTSSSNDAAATVIQKEKYTLFAPVASNGQRGMAKFDTRDFKIDAEGKVSMSDNYINMLAEALQEVNGHFIDDISIKKLSSNTNGDNYRITFKLENEIEHICDFTASRGPQGIQGIQGIQGEKGEKGGGFLVYRGSIGFIEEPKTIDPNKLVGNPIIDSTVVDEDGNLYVITSVFIASEYEHIPTVRYTGVNIKGARGLTGADFLIYIQSIGNKNNQVVGDTVKIDELSLKGMSRIGSTVMDIEGDIYIIRDVSPYVIVEFTGINIRGKGIPSGGTVGQVITKTEDGATWETPQAGGSSPSLLYMSGENGYGVYNVLFKLPIAGAKKITVLYTSQYDSNHYQNEYSNENIVIFDDGQPISGLEFSLLLDYATDENGNPIDRAYIPLVWRDDSTIDFDFYGSSNGSYVGYSGVSMTALFKIEY